MRLNVYYNVPYVPELLSDLAAPRSLLWWVARKRLECDCTLMYSVGQKGHSVTKLDREFNRQTL